MINSLPLLLANGVASGAKIVEIFAVMLKMLRLKPGSPTYMFSLEYIYALVTPHKAMVIVTQNSTQLLAQFI